MIRLLLAATVAAAAFACSVPGVPRGEHTPAGGAGLCADRVAAALVSPNAPVAGSFACLSSDLQQRVTASTQGSGDAALQKIAGTEPVLTSISSHGRTGDGGFFYVQEGTDQGKPVSNLLLLYLDANGRVAIVKWAAQ